MPDDHPLSRFPITRYWHMERRKRAFDLPPPGVPPWLRRFDWLVGWQHGWADVGRPPRSVFCHPEALGPFCAFLDDTFQEAWKTDAILAVGGDDTRLRRQPKDLIVALGRYFQRIYYEALNVERAKVDVMPIGLQEFYLRGVEADFVETIENPRAKTDLVVSAFGAFWPHLDEVIEDRALATAFVSDSDFVTKGPFEREEYFKKLSSAKFMICPLGNGIQSPKIVEAFLNRCVPIMTPSLATERLVAKGAPILVVERWQDIDPAELEESFERMAPAVERFASIAQCHEAWWSFSFG